MAVVVAGFTSRAATAAAAVLLLAACDAPVRTQQELVKRVLDTKAWVRDSDRCPADLIKPDLVPKVYQEVSCKDDALPGCFGRCRARDPNACFSLAFDLQYANVEGPAPEVLFQRACLLGLPTGCTNTAATRLHVDGSSNRLARCTTVTFERTCELSDPWGCAMFGRALLEGQGVRRNRARGLEKLDQGCELAGDELHEICAFAREIRARARQHAGDSDAAP